VRDNALKPCQGHGHLFVLSAKNGCCRKPYRTDNFAYHPGNQEAIGYRPMLNLGKPTQQYQSGTDNYKKQE
jgi:hypothetical protein